MRVILAPKNSGKTEAAVSLAMEQDAYLVCSSRDEVDRIYGTCIGRGLRIRYPLTFDEFLDGRFYRQGVNSFVIDNADILIQRIAGNISVIAVTLTESEEEK